MKRITAVLMTLIFLLSFSACGNQSVEKNTTSTVSSVEDTVTSQKNDIKEGKNTDMNQEQNTEGSKQPKLDLDNNILVAYFSCTNTTEGIAEIIADETGGTLYEIVAAAPYTEDDLKYYTNGRADQEQADSSCRPEISGSVSDMSAYDTVFIGYPIWHGQAPRIINTFLESYDFSGKTMIPFCTSHSSGIGSSDIDLHSLTSDSVVWIDGKRFSSDSDKSEITEWVKMLNLDTQQPTTANRKISPLLILN
jgi:flavodoxin